MPATQIDVVNFSQIIKQEAYLRHIYNKVVWKLQFLNNFQLKSIFVGR
jgi:hypothetical protein